jgi:hypothetical protein
VLAIYAALKAVLHASDISGVLLRVAAYGYRERKEELPQ